MKTEKNWSSGMLAQGGMVAAAYIALTVAFAPISFGPVQMRVSEALTVLPAITPAAVPGLFVGCLLSNLLCGASAADVIFGSLATLLGAAGTWALRGKRQLLWLPPVIANTLIVPWVLKISYGAEDFIFFLAATVGLGELLSVGILGNMLYAAISKKLWLVKR